MQPVLPTWYPIQEPSNPPPSETRGTSPTKNAEVGLWDQFTTQTIHFFNNLFFDPPSLLIPPPDVMNHIFTYITDEKDLVSFRITCKKLSGMELLPDTQLRVFCFKAVGPTGDKLIQAANARPLDSHECMRLGLPYNNSFHCNREDIRAMNNERTLQNDLFKKFRILYIKNKLTDKDFHTVLMAVPITLNKKAACFDNNRFLVEKLKRSIEVFNTRVFGDRIDIYAKQSIEMITPDSFRAQVADLKECFPHIEKTQIKSRLRLEIKIHCKNKIPSRIKEIQDEAKIAEISNELLNPSPRTIESFKSTLKDELEQSKNAPGLTEEQPCEIETKLTNIDKTAQREAQRLILFYEKILS